MSAPHQAGFCIPALGPFAEATLPRSFISRGKPVLGLTRIFDAKRPLPPPSAVRLGRRSSATMHEWQREWGADRLEFELWSRENANCSMYVNPVRADGMPVTSITFDVFEIYDACDEPSWTVQGGWGDRNGTLGSICPPIGMHPTEDTSSWTGVLCWLGRVDSMTLSGANLSCPNRFPASAAWYATVRDLRDNSIGVVPDSWFIGANPSYTLDVEFRNTGFVNDLSQNLDIGPFKQQHYGRDPDFVDERHESDAASGEHQLGTIPIGLEPVSMTSVTPLWVSAEGGTIVTVIREGFLDVDGFHDDVNRAKGGAGERDFVCGLLAGANIAQRDWHSRHPRLCAGLLPTSWAHGLCYLSW
ncbi:hypothetical protein BDK51DRAFT_38032 [Blyttiomyces helicus]|uniref:Uncharacterized protein n=1 Tax=Blyttiomyces helicus TaxID=388810 RepID=A0A4P9W307_9FUNG|nr:hypothetical protein BDK51DRAFT_38032 [Blyttiomyces helicus]|eukprot:RKO86554.1 hypothetical protein BDK51DRAFT_38032 [Blyttiomyces helicus]